MPEVHICGGSGKLSTAARTELEEFSPAEPPTTSAPTFFLTNDGDRVWCVRCKGWKCSEGEDDPCPADVELDECPIQQGDESKWKPVTIEQAQEAIDALWKEYRELDDSTAARSVPSTPHEWRQSADFRRTIGREIHALLLAVNDSAHIATSERHGARITQAALDFTVALRPSTPPAETPEQLDPHQPDPAVHAGQPASLIMSAVDTIEGMHALTGDQPLYCCDREERTRLLHLLRSAVAALRSSPPPPPSAPEDSPNSLEPQLAALKARGMKRVNDPRASTPETQK